ncbi:transposase [Pseudoalteromonas distincta]|uniref:transposase n=1 Tax=Pseudoalteromonas distincta TaxID=77608 RepID=UPI0039EA9A7E
MLEELSNLRHKAFGVDSGGLPVYYELSCGNTHDIVHAESLVANCPTSNVVVADKGYDSETVRGFICRFNSSSR